MPEENKIKREKPKVELDTSGPEVDVTLPEEVKEVIHIINWTYKGLFINLRSSGNNIDEKDILELMDQCEHYYHVLARNFYK